MKRSVWIRLAQAAFIGAVAWGVWRTLAPSLERLTLADFLQWKPAAGPLLAASVLLIVMYLNNAFLWRRILKDLQIGRPDARTTIRIFFVAGLGRYIPGKIMQLVSFGVLAREAGMPALPAVAAAVLGQLAFLTTGLLLLAVLLPGWGGGVPVILAAVALAFAGIGLWVIVSTPIGHNAREYFRSRAGARMGERIEAAFDLADRVRLGSACVWFAGYTWSWVLLGTAFHFFVHAFVPQPIGNAPQIAGSLVASYAAGYVALVPAGIGVREGALATLLARVDAIPASAAVVIALASRIWATVVELIPIAILPLLPGPATDPES